MATSRTSRRIAPTTLIALLFLAISVLVNMSVRSSSGHLTEMSGGCRSPDVDVTTDCTTSGSDSHMHAMSDQPWRRLTDTSTADVARQSSSPRPLQLPPPLTTSCGDRRPSFMISDILGERATLHRSAVDLPTRPTPLVSATAARLASMSAHLDFSAITHRPFTSSTAAAAAAAAVCLQRRGLDDGVDIDRCLQAAEFRRLPMAHDVWTSPVDAVTQLGKRASSYSAECGSDVDVDLDDDNDVDSNSSLVG